MNKFTKIMAAVLATAAITVSAGSHSVSATGNETCKDSQFLNDMGVCPDRWGVSYALFHWGKVSGITDESWAKMCVRSVTRCSGNNNYFINGKEVTRAEAYEYVAKKLDRPYNRDAYFITVPKRTHTVKQRG